MEEAWEYAGVNLIFGFDPGGKSGVAIGRPYDAGIEIKTYQVSSVDGAINWLQNCAGDVAPEVIGIDAFLWWSTAKSGWRKCDWWLRQNYPAVRNSVLCTNNTYGSMAVQGMAFACKARKIWPDAKLNEVHPKVLMHALTADTSYPRGVWPSKYSEAACNWLKECGCSFALDSRPSSEHEFDAALAVWASFQGLRHWDADLVVLHDDDAIHPAGPVHYFWPQRPI